MTNQRTSATAVALGGALALCFGGHLLAATTLFSDFGPGESYIYGSGTAVQAPRDIVAFSFVSGASGFVRQIDLALQLAYGPSKIDTAVVSLWTDASGLPGAELGSWLVPKLDYVTYTGAGHLAQIHGITGVNLTAGQTYFLQVTTTSPDFLDVWWQNSVGAVSAVVVSRGVPYANVPSEAFDVLAAVPEPRAWMLMTLGFGALGGISRRRRAAVGSRP